ncbi:hypothetical protein PInf_002489 [Phytophthora infestans]|nr:hypothetical protein PInf_002489 [Phytophthora infestans]
MSARRHQSKLHFGGRPSDRCAGKGYSVTCPDLAKAELELWEAFHEYLGQYQKETLQVLHTRSTNFSERDKEIKAAVKSSSESIPDEWEVYAKTIISQIPRQRKATSKGCPTQVLYM